MEDVCHEDLLAFCQILHSVLLEELICWESIAIKEYNYYAAIKNSRTTVTTKMLLIAVMLKCDQKYVPYHLVN